MPATITPLVIDGTMVAMYRTVRKIERKMLNYGVSALRLRARQQQKLAADDPNAVTRGRSNHSKNPFVFLKTLKILEFVSICPCVSRHNYASRSNNARSQKRAVLYMAMSYSLTWALSWIPYYVLICVVCNNGTVLSLATLFPLQGLYDFIVYMSPKVRNARNKKRGKLSWPQAIANAWMSRGEKDRAMLQHLQSFVSRFMDRRRSKSSTSLSTSLKVGAVSGAAVQLGETGYK